MHGIQSGNDGDLDRATPYISKVRASGKDPSLFFASGKGTPEISENMAESHDCCTGDIVCRFPMKKTWQIYTFSLKIFEEIFGLGGKPRRPVDQ